MKPAQPVMRYFFNAVSPLLRRAGRRYVLQMGSFAVPVGEEMRPAPAFHGAHVVAHGAAQHAVVQRAPRGPVRCRWVRGQYSALVHGATVACSPARRTISFVNSYHEHTPSPVQWYTPYSSVTAKL